MARPYPPLWFSTSSSGGKRRIAPQVVHAKGRRSPPQAASGRAALLAERGLESFVKTAGGKGPSPSSPPAAPPTPGPATSPAASASPSRARATSRALRSGFVESAFRDTRTSGFGGSTHPRARGLCLPRRRRGTCRHRAVARSPDGRTRSRRDAAPRAPGRACLAPGRSGPTRTAARRDRR